jgi:hypothetical protein
MKTALRPVDGENNPAPPSLAAAWRVVAAAGYDPDRHGEYLQCADRDCHAVVHYMAPVTSHAGSCLVAAHFRSESRADHRPGCSALDGRSYDHNSVALTQARDGGMPILFSLNFPLGDHRFRHFGRISEVEKRDTPYNRFRRQHPHASVSIRSIGEVFSKAARIAGKNLGALQQVYFSHCQDMRKLSDAVLGDDHAKFRTLHEVMAGGGAAFPRLITFRPTRAHMNGTSHIGPLAMNGTPVELGLQNGGPAKLILLNQLRFSDTDMSKQVLANGESVILAQPSLDRSAAARALQAFEAGGVGYVSLTWHVVSSAQIHALTEKERAIFSTMTALPLSRPPTAVLYARDPENSEGSHSWRRPGSRRSRRGVDPSQLPLRFVPDPAA